VTDAFACLALTDCDVSDDIPATIDLHDVTASRALPYVLPEHWGRWLGELTCRALGRDALFLYSRASVQHGHDAHEVAATLLKRLTFMWHGVILQGVPNYDDALSMLGTATDAHDLRSFQSEPAYLQTAGARRFTVGEAELRRGVLLGERIARLDPETREFDRLRRGSRSFFVGARELHADDRLHSSARALEALIVPAIGRTRAQFVRRCSEFAAPAPENGEALEQIYDIRSKVEHMHEPVDALSGGSREECAARADRRTRQAEALTRFCLARVLERDELLAHFQTDDRIRAFWLLPADERARLWGERFDLAAVQ
jgi:hypothetical protein